MDGEKITAWFFGIIGCTLILMILICAGLWMFACHDKKPYLKINSMDHVTVYSVMLDRKWGDDRVLYVSPDQDKAHKFYFKILKKY